jgi:hypothetical protein
VLSLRSSYHLVKHCYTVYNQYTLNTMTEIDVKTVLKAVWADQKKTNAFLKKVFSFAPKDSTAIDAEQLVKKLDKNGLASLVIDAVVRLTESMDVTQRTTVQIDLCKDEMIMSNKKIDKLQSKLIDNQELSIQKLLESAESLAKVSDVVKAEVNEVVTERKKTYADLLAKQESVELEVPKKAVEKNVLLAREVIAEVDRQRNVIIRGYNLETLADDEDNNVGSENRSYSYAPTAVDYLIRNGLKKPSLTDSVQKVTLVGKPYFPPVSKYDDKVPNCDGEDHRLQTVKVTFTTKEAAREFLRLRFNLKDHDDDYYSKYYLSPDRSPSDRKRLKELVEEKKRKIVEFPEKTWKITKFLKLESCDRN